MEVLYEAAYQEVELWKQPIHTIAGAGSFSTLPLTRRPKRRHELKPSIPLLCNTTNALHASASEKTFENFTIVSKAQLKEDILIAGDDTHETCQDETGAAISLIASLKICAKKRDLQRGRRLHEEIDRKGLLATNVFIGSTLINMYAKCGDLEKAQEVFDKLRVQNVVAWNALIAGYAQNDRGKEALDHYARMHHAGNSPDAITFTCALKACGSIRDSEKGQEIHEQVVRERLLEKDAVVANALVAMYAKCGELEKAQGVFDELSLHNTVSYNALIVGYAQHGHSKEALECFEQMQCRGLSPSAITFPCLLKACGCLGALDKGEEIHHHILRLGLLENDTVVGNALVDMYAKCGALGKSRQVFDEIRIQNIISWTALISGYAQHGHGKEALNCFECMRAGKVSPNAITYACALKACGLIGALDKGINIHNQIIQEQILEKDAVIGTGLVDMYAKCGALQKAENLFNELCVRDVVSWNALIAGYVQHHCGEQAFNLFERMQLEGFSPDMVTYACILKACGSIGASQKGQSLHTEVVKCGLYESDKDVGNSLVIMYANLGMLEEAQELFDKLAVQEVVAWSALMAGYAHVGDHDMVLDLFNKMIREGIEPDAVTFTIVLNTCSHKGLSDKGQMYYEMISKDYDMAPSLEHHTCMVDLFCRVGDLHKAAAIMDGMPLSPNLTMWHTFMSACVKLKDVEFGEWAFEHVVRLDEKDGAAYICMSNIYVAAGRVDDAKKIEALRKRLQLRS